MHDLDGERVRLGRSDGGGHGDKSVTGERPKKTFGHLASCRISSGEEKHSRFMVRDLRDVEHAVGLTCD
jgi:hypothetical protein